VHPTTSNAKTKTTARMPGKRFNGQLLRYRSASTVRCRLTPVTLQLPTGPAEHRSREEYGLVRASRNADTNGRISPRPIRTDAGVTKGGGRRSDVDQAAKMHAGTWGEQRTRSGGCPPDRATASALRLVVRPLAIGRVHRFRQVGLWAPRPPTAPSQERKAPTNRGRQPQQTAA